MSSTARATTTLLRAVVALSAVCASAYAASPADVPADLLAPAGLAVHVGTTDGAAEVRLAEGGRTVVQGLALDDASLRAARQAVAAAGRYGAASVRRVESAAALPYVDNLVTLLVVDADALGAKAPAAAECLRVVHPEGVVLARRGGKWERIVKPMPQSFGEWTHAYGSADNNMRSPDAAVGAPTALRWISGPACDEEGAVANGLRVGSGVAVHDLHFSPWNGDYKWIEGRNAFNGLPQFLVPLQMETFKTRPTVVSGNRVFTYLAEGEQRTNGKVDGKPGSLVALDADTGKTLRVFDKADPFVFHDGRERDKYPGNNLIFADGALFQTAGNHLQALDPDSGTVRWEYKAGGADAALDFPSCASAGNLLVVAEGRHERLLGRNARMNAAHVVAFDAKTGREVWRTPLADTGVAEWSRDGGKPISQIACVGDGVYLYRTGGASALKLPRGADGRGGESDTQYLAALDGKTGQVLWSHEGFDSRDTHSRDGNDKVFDVGGQKLEMTVIGGRIYLMSGGVAVFDARTGQTLSVVDFGNSRCDASHAAANLLELGFGNFIDLASPEPRVLRSEIVRGHCATGTFPAYGMTFGTPSRCRCAVVLHAYLALSSDPVAQPVADESRLARGEALHLPDAPSPSQDEWPTFLGTPQRSSAAGATLAADLKPLWQAEVAKPADAKASPLVAEWRLSGMYNGPVSAPVVAGGRFFVAVPFEHRVEARSVAKPDQTLWSFTAGGRLDSPPTVYRNLCLFGSHDGRIYCLDAATGMLRWSFLAAPTDRQIVAYGQPESAWPLYGSVAVVNETAVAIAGYHPETDGGLYAWGLDPATGGVKWKRRVDRDRNWLPVDGKKADQPSYVGGRASGGYNSNSIANSLAVSDGRLVSIQGYVFDAATGKPTTDDRPAALERPRPGRPVPPAPTLPDAVDAHMPFSLSFNETSPERSALYQTFHGPGHHNGTWDFAIPATKFEADPFRVAWAGDTVVLTANGGWHAGDDLERYDATKGPVRTNKPLWSIKPANKSARVALALAGETVVVAERTWGNPLDDSSDQGKLELRSLPDGKVLQTIDLPAPPLDNGLAVAGGRLYVTCVDGAVRCYGK